MPLSSVDKVRHSANAEYSRASRAAASNNTSVADERQRSDSVEISTAARKLSESGASADNFEKIRGRIKSGFYDRPDVQRQIAVKVAKESAKKTHDAG
ncbi:hypothetical protein MASR2M18_06820 [Ignavibacteria bacterium]|nr:hypothetical protein [Bacteroidota bacterium]MCZ2131699.1 hypothetical protein [Bacteroidota bacterium]